MVKRSFFSRLFGRGGSTEAEAEIPAPARRDAARAPQGAARTATKSRLPDIDFEDAPAAAKPASAPSKPGSAASRPNTNGGQSAPAGKTNGATNGPTAKVATNPGVRADAPSAPESSNSPNSPKVTVDAMPVMPSLPAESPAPPVRATEMTRNEELALKLQDGYTGLSSVLRGIDTKIDQQQKTSEELIVSVRKLPDMIKDMPDASRAGLELLNTISGILEFQGRSTNELLQKMRELPGSLDAMEVRFQEQVSQVARVGQDADRVAKETQSRLTSAFDGVKRSVEDVQIHAARRQDALVDELKRHQQSQDERVAELLKRMGSSNRLVIFLMVVAVVALLIAVWGMQA